MRSVAVLGLLILLALPAAAATDPSNDPANVTPADPADALTVGTVEAPAGGPAVVDLLRANDLFGTFARDCGRPAAPINPHVRVTEETGGLVIETHDFGLESSANIYSVRAARRPPRCRGRQWQQNAAAEEVLLKRRRRFLNVQQFLAGELGVFLDEFEARFGLVAHQPLDRTGRRLDIGVRQRDLEQRPL
jgi:hypothetical protein